MVIHVPLNFPDGCVWKTPLDEIIFKDDGNYYESCHEYVFEYWQDLPLKAWLNGEGALQDVTLAANYSGLFVCTEYDQHPIEHIDPLFCWDLPLSRGINGQGVTLTVEQKTAIGIPTGDRPPFPTTFYYKDRNEPDESPPRPLAGSERGNLDGCAVVYEHPVAGLHRWTGRPELAIELAATSLPEPAAPARKKLFISGAELLLQSVEVQKLIGKLIERNSTGQLFGPSGDGKSFTVIDLGLSVTTGATWNGHQCEQGMVLYFAGEGHNGALRRVKAWWLHQGQPAIDDFHISRSTITLDTTGLAQIAAEVRELESQSGKKVALIIVDTLARHLQGDENSTKDMSEFVRLIDSLRDSFPGSSAIVVHHTGNDTEKLGRSRGSSALKAACDFEIQCFKGQLTFTKVKDGEPPPPIDFKLVPVQVGTDEEGQPITSCIVQHGERSAKNKETNLTPYEQSALDVIREEPGVLIGDLREAFYTKRRILYPDAKPGTLKKAFDRSIESLTRKKIIFVNGYAVFEGQGTHGRHSKDMSRQKEGTDRDTLYKGVPMSLTGTDANPPF